MIAAARYTLAAFLFCFAGTAEAQQSEPSRWLIQAGATRLAMIDDASVAVAGINVPDAGVKSDAQIVPSVSVTRFISPAFGVSVAAGLPPTIKYRGAGTLAGTGALLDVKYAAPAVTLVWSPRRNRSIAPYLGGGVTYMHVLSTDGRTLQDAHVDDDVGPVFQAGIGIFPHYRVGGFFDIKKALVRTRINGLVGGAPAETRLRMDPVVVQVGVALRL